MSEPEWQEESLVQAVDRLAALLVAGEEPTEMSGVLQSLSERFPPDCLYPMLQERFGTNRFDLYPLLGVGQAPKVIGNDIRTIAIYLDDPGVGGIQRVACLEAKLLTNAGFKVVLIVPFGADDLLFDLPPQVTVVTLGIRHRPAAEQLGVLIRELTEIVTSHSVDLVISHANYRPLVFYVNLALGALAIPSLLTVHSFSLRSVFALTDLLYSLRTAGNAMSGLTVLSRVDQKFWQLSGVPNTFYLPNPIDFTASDEFLARHIEAAQPKVDVVWMGRFQEDTKRVSEMVDIFALVVQQHPDAQLRIVTPSKPSDRVYEDVLAKIESRGLAANVQIEPSPANVYECFSSSRVVVNTSRIEGFGYTIAEPLQVKVPVVMYDLPYLELPKDNPGVISVPWGDREAAASAIVSLLENPDEARQRGQAGYDHLAAQFSDQRWLRYFTEIISNITQNNRIEAPNANIQDDDFGEILVSQLALLLEDGLKRQAAEKQKYQDTIKELNRQLKASTRELSSYKKSRAYRLASAYGSLVGQLKVRNPNAA